MSLSRALSELMRWSDAAAMSDAALLVLAAHPDDETIGASSLLHEAPHCVIVHLTDGAPHDRALWARGQTGDRSAYAHLRRAEAETALGLAGILPEQILGFGCADQVASQHLVTLTRGFARVLEAVRPSAVITHAYEGGHPDHDAAAFVAAHALPLLAAEVRPALVEMTSYHGAFGHLVTGQFLERGAPITTRVLTPEQRARKRAMIAAYASQHETLAAFELDRERFRAAPAYDFTRPPHAGVLHYERMGWSMRSAEFCELAARAEELLADDGHTGGGNPEKADKSCDEH
jgi:LmbE family N-acetylglucosaminyl deacetylase